MSDLAEQWKKLAAEMADRGLLIESGWLEFLEVFEPAGDDIDAIKREGWRSIFFCGAMHMLIALVGSMSHEKELPAEMQHRCELLRAEMAQFIKDHGYGTQIVQGTA